VLGAILPALVIIMTDGEANFAMALAICVTVYAGFRLSYLSFYSPRSILQLTFWMFVYCWLGLAASAQLKSGHFPWQTATSGDDLILSEAMIILGIGAYEISVRFRGKPTVARPRFFTLGSPSLSRFVLLTVACVAMSSWAIYRKGGLSEVLQTRYEIQRTAKSSGKALSENLIDTSLQRVPPVVALLVAVYLLSEKLSSRRKRRFLALSATALVLFNLVANYPPSLPRTYLGFILVSIAALLLRNRLKLVPLFILSMIVGLVFLFPYADYFRSARGYSADDLTAPTQKLIEKGDYDAFQMVANTVKAVRQRGVVYGYNFLGAFLFYVPRSIWPEKPHGTGYMVGEVVGYSFLVLSSPLWAEFYYGGGIPLLIVGFWAYGYMTRRAERQEFRSPATAVFIAYAAGVQIYLLRGDLLNSVALFGPGALLLFMFVGRRVSSRSRVERPARIAYSQIRGWQAGGSWKTANVAVREQDGSYATRRPATERDVQVAVSPAESSSAGTVAEDGG
jgi:hypothetical protein